MARIDKLTSFDVVGELARALPDVDCFHLLDVPSPPEFQKRVEHLADFQESIHAGVDLRDRFGISFWDGLLAYACSTPKASLLAAFNAALLHDPSKSRLRQRRSSQLSEQELTTIMASLPLGRMLAISSLVLLKNGERKHIPMIDFRCRVTETNLDVVKAALQALQTGPGTILDSGASFHFVGTSLISESELFAFLARGVLLSPVVDRRWAAHQIIESACALRIGISPRYSSLPSVVARV